MKQTCGINAIKIFFFSWDNRWSVSPMCTADADRNSYGSSYLVFVMFVTFQPKLKNSDNFSKKSCVISNFTNICSTVLQLHTDERKDGRAERF